jgi:hypothetical protein
VEYNKKKEGIAVAISPDGGFKYASFFADTIGDEGMPKVETTENDHMHEPS